MKKARKLNIFAVLMMAVASSTPVVLVIGISLCVQGEGVIGPLIIAGCMLSIFISGKLLKWAIRDMDMFSIQIESADPLESDVIGTITSTLLPLLILDPSKITLASTLAAIPIILIFASFSDSHKSASWYILGYKTYKIKSSTGIGYMMVSKVTLNNVKDVKLVSYLTNGMIVNMTPEE